jgi:hypothetical protein
MKKRLIAALVGGLIIFFWQFLSNAALDLHRPAQQYTANQDSILNYLSTHLKEGKYFLPTFPAGASSEEMQQSMEKSMGKPWAIIDYKESMTTNMGMNMTRGLIIDIIMVWLFISILSRGKINTLGGMLYTSLVIGVLNFLFFPYTNFIWYESPGIYIEMLDAIAAWGLCGLWLGFFLREKPAAV